MHKILVGRWQGGTCGKPAILPWWCEEVVRGAVPRKVPLPVYSILSKRTERVGGHEATNT